MKNYEFYRSFHGRGMKLDALAAELGTKPSHLSMVFNGQRGGNTRKHIAKHLTASELKLLGWNELGELVAPKLEKSASLDPKRTTYPALAPSENKLSSENKLHVEHSAISVEHASRRAICRNYARVYLRRGKIQRQPCRDCGDKKSEMHHADYSKPLDVTWLCRTCHLKWHGNVDWT